MNKNVNIFTRPPNTPGAIYYASFRGQVREGEAVRTKQFLISTGTPVEKLAQAIANKARNDKLMELHGLTPHNLAPKRREDSPTCGQIVDRYLSACPVKTRKRVADDFLTVVGGAFAGKAAHLATRREAARSVRLSALNAEAMRRYRDNPGREITPTAINARIRSAKSIFCDRAREYYDGVFRIPACVSEWTGVSFLVDKKSKAYRRLDPKVLAEMDRDSAVMLQGGPDGKLEGRLAVEWRNAWAAYWLSRRCGLRNNCETANLRWEWFSHREDGSIWLELRRRSYWSPKGSERDVPVHPELFRQLCEIFADTRSQGPSAYVLAGNASNRSEGCLRWVNKFVRRYVPDREKGVYELRKQFGSEVARDYSIETAARMLGHADLKTTWDHYYDDLKTREVQPR